MRFLFPEPLPPNGAQHIYPLFIPFAGCPMRCVFCSQNAQTGRRDAGPLDFSALLQEAGEDIAGLRNPPELAFYGGTFTALPEKERQACMDFAAGLKARGLITRLRCSTRPDAVSPALLAALKKQGLNCVELGVQSFANRALERSRRGYSGATALAACRMVQEAGLELGAQLMPGMPGMLPEDFERDIDLCAALAPATLRIYPCLVLDGTPLAEWWRQGQYQPWPLELCLELMAPALLKVWAVGTRVIRMGLAPEPALAPQILAGPQHPALGQVARSLAMYLFLRQKIQAGGLDGQPALRPGALYAPRRFQGEFFGQKNALLEKYKLLGLDKSNVFWWDEPEFMLQLQQV